MAPLSQHSGTVASDQHPPINGFDEPNERRQKLRIAGRYPARVRWADRDAGAVRQVAVLDNLSSNGLYMRASREIGTGQKVFVAFQMIDTQRQLTPERVPKIAVRGSVLRTELLGDGSWGIVVKFGQYRFI